MTRKILLTFIVLVATGASALAGHYQEKKPKEVDGVPLSKCAVPPVIVLPGLPNDTCKETPQVDVWLKLRLGQSDSLIDISMIWCSIDDTAYEAAALRTVKGTSFARPGAKKDNRPQWYYHSVRFRPVLKEVCELSGEARDSLKFTDPPVRKTYIYPEFPKVKLGRGDSAEVWVKCLISPEGEVVDAAVRETSGYPALDTAAMQASYFHTFEPALKEGKPVAVWVSYKVLYKN